MLHTAKLSFILIKATAGSSGLSVKMLNSLIKVYNLRAGHTPTFFVLTFVYSNCSLEGSPTLCWDRSISWQVQRNAMRLVQLQN